MQDGTIDAVQSDDDSMAAPTDVAVFGGYFPLALRYSLDVPMLFSQYGLGEIWDKAYEEVGVKWISAGAWDPCHFAIKDPIRSLADLEGKRIFTFPTAGRFLQRFGVVPVTLPWEDVEAALQAGELDGVAWSGITENYTVGWADVTRYFLTNNISGAWIGHFFANQDRWNELPHHLKTLWRLATDASHYFSSGVLYNMLRPLIRKHSSSKVRFMRSTKPLVLGVQRQQIGTEIRRVILAVKRQQFGTETTRVLALNDRGGKQLALQMAKTIPFCHAGSTDSDGPVSDCSDAPRVWRGTSAP